MTTPLRKVPAGEFKAKCLALLDDVASTGENLVVTKHGKPVAVVVPFTEPDSLIGSILHEEDLVEPTGEVWDAER
jgi:prevent-host-death family protein